MSDFPNLEQIGVTSTADVIKYTLTRESRSDVLKIYYQRQPNSLLAKSKKFRFARGQNHIQIDPQSNSIRPQHVAPILLLVIEELRLLTSDRPKQKRDEIKASIDERLNDLETVFESKLYHLTKQFQELD
ncbi:MAG: hypothetical protein OFPII_00980 [Osedax symbiont Rs1]|nr:MAG: hypothetical protein OFPII_00980 [Osedax symbiont Rs1]